jgi:hypothetical protein
MFTSLHGYNIVTMVIDPHACWVSNVTVLKTGRSVREHGVSHLYYGPLYENKNLDNM